MEARRPYCTPTPCRIVLLLMLVSGCDIDDALKSLGLSRGHYELKQDTDGRPVRLDPSATPSRVLVSSTVVNIVQLGVVS